MSKTSLFIVDFNYRVLLQNHRARRRETKKKREWRNCREMENWKIIDLDRAMISYALHPCESNVYADNW